MNVMKERLKSVLLVALVISSLVLTQINLFDGIMISEGSSAEVDVSSTQLSDYINPQSFFISFGGLSYTRVYDFEMQDSIWSETRPFILSCFLNHNSIDEIDRESYIEAFSDRSLLIRMPLSLSIGQFYSLFSEEALSDDIKDITVFEYLIREDEQKTLYIYDQVNEKYYKVDHSTATHDVGALVDGVLETDWIVYRKLSDRFSLSSTVDESYNQLNYELVPYRYDFSVDSILVDHEVHLDEARFNEDIESISNAVFGNRLDFVKRLQDVNESVILMYGYGDKSLTVTPEGLISYRKKFDVTRAETFGFKESFALALGKIEQFGLMPEGLFLEKYLYRQDEKSYTFFFNYRINSFAIAEMASEDYPITVVVKENQVVSVDKDVKRYVDVAEDTPYKNSETLFTIDDCITNNFLEVSVYYLQDNNLYDQKTDPMEFFFPIRSEIESVDLRYYGETADYMIPVWQVVIDERTYIFNAYDGKLIKTYR